MRSVGVVFETEVHPASVDSGGGEVGEGEVCERRSKSKPEEAKPSEVEEDLLDLDYSGFGPAAVQQDVGWSMRPSPNHNEGNYVFDKRGPMLAPVRLNQSITPIPGGFTSPPQHQQPPMPGMQPTMQPTMQALQPVSSIHSLQNAPQQLQPVSSLHQIQPMQPTMQPAMQPMQPMQNMQPMQPIQPMQNMQPMQPMQPMQNMQNMQNMQPLQGQSSPPFHSPQPSQPLQPLQPSQFNAGFASPAPEAVSLFNGPSYNVMNPTRPSSTFSVDYMFSPNPQEPFSPPQPPAQPFAQPFAQPPVPPPAPSLLPSRPAQPPSLLGKPADSSKTTIVPLMNPAREPPMPAPAREPPTPTHRRGLSSVVRNAGLVEDDSSEDEVDYESRIEKSESQADEALKRKVMTALQSALSDLQLTGIQIRWSEIEVDERIGVGGFAIVYHGMYRGCEVAVKKLRVSRMSAKAIRDFHSEVVLMRALRHPNIVIFMGLVMDPVCLVTEYCHNGNLFDLLHDTVDENEEHYAVQIPWQRRVRIALDVARGMNFLHTSTPIIIHRDLKSLNILVDEKWTAKVSDFGLSRFKVRRYFLSVDPF